MRPVRVVVLEVLGEYGFEMPAVKDEQAIETEQQKCEQAIGEAGKVAEQLETELVAMTVLSRSKNAASTPARLLLALHRGRDRPPGVSSAGASASRRGRLRRARRSSARVRRWPPRCCRVRPGWCPVGWRSGAPGRVASGGPTARAEASSPARFTGFGPNG